MKNNKVLCRCGQAMTELILFQPGAVDENYRWCVDYRCACGWHSPLRYGKAEEEARKLAYEAATRRPPNKPLTEEQIMEMINDEAIWSCGRDSEGYDIYVHDAWDTRAHLKNADFEDYLFFAAKPTEADIEAARKDRSKSE